MIKRFLWSILHTFFSKKTKKEINQDIKMKSNLPTSVPTRNHCIHAAIAWLLLLLPNSSCGEGLDRDNTVQNPAVGQMMLEGIAPSSLVLLIPTTFLLTSTDTESQWVCHGSRSRFMQWLSKTPQQRKLFISKSSSKTFVLSPRLLSSEGESTPSQPGAQWDPT